MAKTMTFGGLVLEEVRSVTRPILKVEAGKDPVIVEVQSAIHMAEDSGEGRKKKGEDGKELPPPELMDVFNLQTGEESVVVVNSVLGSELRAKYPNDGYVGKQFFLQKIAPNTAAGKRYATFTIKEVKVSRPAPATETQATASAPATPAKGKGK